MLERSLLLSAAYGNEDTATGDPLGAARTFLQDFIKQAKGMLLERSV